MRQGCSMFKGKGTVGLECVVSRCIMLCCIMRLWSYGGHVGCRS
jgi:hypothetical protein